VSRKVARCLVRSLRRRNCDSLTCVDFNLTLEKFKRDSGIQSRGTTFCNPVQLLAFADCVDIIGRSGENVDEFL
jgi:hypothetical protein